MKKSFIMLSVFIALLITSVPSHAALLMDWDFLNSGGTYGANDSVIQQAQLVNLQTSDQNFIGQFVAAHRSPFAIPAGTYVGEFGPPNGLEDFFDQFAGINLAPGETFDFIFASYVPNVATSPGAYFTVNSIDFGGRGTPTFTVGRQFHWTVEGSTSNVVPEPATLILFGTGIAGMIFRRKKIKFLTEVDF